jgi:hypothetical protein
MLNVPYIGPRMLTRGAAPSSRFFLGRHPALGHAELGEDPGHRAVGAFPLVLVDGARQEALDGFVPCGVTPAADHLGDGAGDDHGGQRRVERVPGALHRALGAVAAQLFLAEPGDDDGQFVRRQPVGVVQHGGHRQVLAAHRAVDDDLKALHGGEGVDAPQ